MKNKIFVPLKNFILNESEAKPLNPLKLFPLF